MCSNYKKETISLFKKDFESFANMKAWTIEAISSSQIDL